MKLSFKLAGLCGSGAFIVTALPGFYHHLFPTDISQLGNEAIPTVALIETLFMSLGGAFLAGFMGYKIGNILSNPKGKSKKKDKMLSQNKKLPVLTTTAKSPPLSPPSSEEMPDISATNPTTELPDLESSS